MIVNLDGEKIVELITEGSTICLDYAEPYWLRVSPTDYFSYVSTPEGYWIRFNDDVTKYYLFGRIVRMVQKSTVKNPVTIGDEDYNCVILGDGT